MEMDAGGITQDALVFSGIGQENGKSFFPYHSLTRDKVNNSHSPPKADSQSNTSTNSHHTDHGSTTYDLDQLHVEAMADLFGETDPPAPSSLHSQSQSKSPDHPPPPTQSFYNQATEVQSQSSAYSLIDPELRPAPPAVLSRQSSWQDSSETEFSESDFFQPTRRSSVESGIVTSGDDLGGENEPGRAFLDPTQQTVEDGQGVPPPKPKKSHARKVRHLRAKTNTQQPPGHIPRARNAFILFRKHITVSVCVSLITLTSRTRTSSQRVWRSSIRTSRLL
jgi:hypothetical protein